MNKIISFLKKQAVLVVAWCLAIFSAFFVHPDSEYFGYIDWRSLGILWSLMVVMGAFRLLGVFEAIGKWLLGKVKRIWQLSAVLIFLCFFFSMLVTNDVALITFVPFAIMILEACNCQHLMILVIVLQTIGANLGSMLTPIGNPQNLYLFGLGGFDLLNFVKLMLPYSAVSFILLVFFVIYIGIKNKTVEINKEALNFEDSASQNQKENQKQISPALKITNILIYSVLTLLAIMSVLHIVPVPVLFGIILLISIILQPKAIINADYGLLFTFVGFFIFTGNIARIDFINNALQTWVGGKEILFGIAASQIISNVPAALLLSGFSKSVSALVVGVNLGGLGTLIASMASLISYKFYAASNNSKSGKYLGIFTALNLAFLVVLVLCCL